MSKKGLELAWALRDAWRQGYSIKHFGSDLQSGCVVGMVAIPLAMALAIASGVSPQHGLYTAIFAGVIVALLGGSRFQVTGPTAAFVVLLVPIVHAHGVSGLLVAGLLAGLILIGFGLIGLGRIIQFVPHPVTTGFTSGIALVIAAIQIKDFFGLTFEKDPENFVERLGFIVQGLPHMQWPELLVGCFTLGALLLCIRYLKRTPAPLMAIAAATLFSILIKKLWPEINIETIASRFSFESQGIWGAGIPPHFPHFILPWTAQGDDAFGFSLTLQNIKAIFPSAFAIAILGAIESLLSAVIADGMTHYKHRPNVELIALGIGNVVCPFFGGIPATGAIARTTTNIRFGAKSPLSSVIHALFILGVMLLFAPAAGYLPMASLSALLLYVAYGMSEKHHFINILKIGNRDDKTVLLTCFGLTVFMDMTIGVTVGVVLASFLFIRRMSALTHTRALSTPSQISPNASPITLPDSVVWYEISGPMFFGAANRAVDTLNQISNDVKNVVLDLRKIHSMDITGLVALASSIENVLRSDRTVFLIITDPHIEAYLRKHRLFAAHSEKLRVITDSGNGDFSPESIIHLTEKS